MTPAFLEAGANISNQQLEETSLLENILLIIKSEFLDGNAGTPLLVNSVFDGDQIKIRGEKKTFILTFLKAGLREEVKSCDQRRGEEKKVIDIPHRTHGLCRKRAGEDGEEGKNRNVLLNVSNDHKHINHGTQRPELEK